MPDEPKDEIESTEPSPLQLATLSELANEIMDRCATAVMWVEVVSGPDQSRATSWIKGNPASVVGSCRLLSRECLSYADAILYGGGDGEQSDPEGN